ncbi:MAG TPA: hypothetical protein VN181_01915 [Thermoanaerobaculia bacterium]|nr:hypothetical protein [Thermoanaerobaculia bacterium]
MTLPWERAARRIGRDAFDALVEMPGSALASLLLEVYAKRADALTPADVLRRFNDDAFVTPSPVDQREMLRLDAHLLAHIPSQFEAVELSPLAPFGTCSAMAPVDAKKVLATIRNTEVLSDPTNVMAMICARRRDREDEIRLCNTQRLVRTTRVRDTGHSQHFRILTMCTAGRDRGNQLFEENAVVEHLDVLLTLMTTLPSDYVVDELAITLACAAGQPCDRIRARLAERWPSVEIRADEERLGKSAYYKGIAFKLWVGRAGGPTLPLGDGGLVDWTARLRADRKERLMISAIGTEVLAKLFGVRRP